MKFTIAIALRSVYIVKLFLNFLLRAVLIFKNLVKICHHKFVSPYITNELAHSLFFFYLFVVHNFCKSRSKREMGKGGVAISFYCLCIGTIRIIFGDKFIHLNT